MTLSRCLRDDVVGLYDACLPLLLLMTHGM